MRKAKTPRPGAKGFSDFPRRAKPGKSERIARADAPRSAWAIATKNAFPIVGLGASAGGWEALEEFFAHTPPDSGIAFVGVTHQHPGHTSLLPELPRKRTPMPVVEVSDHMRVKPNCVYVARPEGYLAILDGKLQLVEQTESPGLRLPIDYFFRSLADDQRERAVGIILTTPFDMTVMNEPDRFHLVMDTIDRVPQTGDKGVYLEQQLKDKLVEHKQYICQHGQDLPEIRNWKWKE